MTLITCTLTNTTFNVKKICKVSEMPKNAFSYWTAYTPNGVYDIFMTPNGVYYSKPARNY